LDDLVVLALNAVSRPIEIVTVPILDPVPDSSFLDLGSDRDDGSLVEGFAVVDVNHVRQFPDGRLHSNEVA